MSALWVVSTVSVRWPNLMNLVTARAFSAGVETGVSTGAKYTQLTWGNSVPVSSRTTKSTDNTHSIYFLLSLPPCFTITL
ncbi:hypothetical protein M422DRAFT_274774 [Sphaerobolus stellatus SS14]|uniref:Unplaced genomic scaffold SPHSTscaffold_414, whole genome shotgun sequence n=1 Tax=Sphaerobolus stellatus (strain SS14) TaxID=990650 RepID=A0A0C9UH03_SPHS4|nr:hypothetical protein M422DRAFT_274774 [Sphaerobolus stellatus SS14]